MLHTMHNIKRKENSMNAEMLKKRIKDKGMNVEALAEKIGIDKSTMYRKINKDISTTIAEAAKIKDVLALTEEDTKNIFFG